MDQGYPIVSKSDCMDGWEVANGTLKPEVVQINVRFLDKSGMMSRRLTASEILTDALFPQT